MFDHFVNGSVQERKKFHLVIIRENNKVITISLNPHPPPKKTDKNATHVHLIYEGDEFFFFFFLHSTLFPNKNILMFGH